MSSYDTIIEGGYLVDGTGSPGTYSDVAILDGKVAAIGDLKSSSAATRIDAQGKIVAPGHITQHTHYDCALFWDPYVSNSGENGVTTVVNANCGFGIAPVRPADQERCMGMLETTEQIPVAHQRAALPWDWESFPEYLERVRGLEKGVNVLTFLPLNPLLVYVMGIDGAKNRRPSDIEMKEMHRLINEAMDAGAIGISMSVMGADGNSHLDIDGSAMPSDAIDHDVIMDISRAVVERGEGVIQLLSQIVFYGDRSITERIAELAKGTGVRVIHNVFLTHDLLPHTVEEDLAWLDGLRARGLDVTAGCMLNRGWVEADVTQLDAAAGQLPAVRQIVGCQSHEAVLALISQPDFAEAFAQQYAESGPSSGAAGFESQTVLDVGDHPELAHYCGRTLGAIAEEQGSNVIDILLELAIKSKLALQLKSGPIAATDPTQARTMMAHSAVVPGGSDGGAHTKTFGMGHYPTDLLIWMVREENLITLEDMHFQLSLKAARSVQLSDRGALLPGYNADILVYDLDALYFDRERYEIVHDMPNGDWRRKGKAGGYDYILVNGTITHQQDRPTGNTPGELVQVTRNLGSQKSAA
jgi:N-acyl-D-aspartate/D-glutamate deacylase